MEHNQLRKVKFQLISDKDLTIGDLMSDEALDSETEARKGLSTDGVANYTKKK